MVGVRKCMLLAGMILALTAAAPATGSASVWKHEGVDLTEHTEIGIHGVLAFGSAAGGYQCTLVATLTTEGGESALLTSVTIYEISCKGSGGLANCLASSVKATNLPWIVYTSGSHLLANGILYDITFIGGVGCPLTEAEVSFPELTVAPDKPSAISTLKLSGEGTATTNLGTYTVKTFESPFTVEEALAGTYGIG